MDLDGRIVFVAGAGGLAGSSVVRRLLAACPGVRVRAAHRSRNGCFLDDVRVDYVRGDLRSLEDCRRLMEGCSLAVLTAANSGGAQQAVTEPWAQVTDNLVMDAQLLQALHLEGVPRAVYVSSATVYPEADGLLREDDLDWNQDPPSAYFGIGWAKRSAEKLCRFWHDKAGLEVIVARSANIFGPFSKFDPRTANVIPALIRKAVDRMDPFEVWGSPDVTRDVIVSDDFGDAIVALLRAGDIAFDVFNVGTGRPITVGAIVDQVLKQAGHNPSRVVWRSDRPVTARFRALDCDKIHRATGWWPKIGITEGINVTVRWWEENRTSWTR